MVGSYIIPHGSCIGELEKFWMLRYTYVHPTGWGKEMIRRSPSVEQRVVAHA